jgi:hypothetical protein
MTLNKYKDKLNIVGYQARARTQSIKLYLFLGSKNMFEFQYTLIVVVNTTHAKSSCTWDKIKRYK